MDASLLFDSQIDMGDFFVIIKLFILLGLLLYLIFSVVVLRQVKMMLSALHGFLESSLMLVAWAHLLLAVLVFGLAMVLL